MARTIPLERYRNIGILASQDAGRTTTTERILAAARRAESVGSVAGGDILGSQDPAPQDNDRAITLTSAATSCLWRGSQINIVDLSAVGGRSVDGRFLALDGAVAVLDGTAGRLGAAEAALQAADRSGLRYLVFVNKLDSVGTDLAGLVEAAGSGNALPALIQLPIGDGVQGLIDLVEMTAKVWREPGFDAPAQDEAVPAAYRQAAEVARAHLVLAVGAEDPALPAVELRALLRAAVLAGRVLPVLCGSAFRNRGIEALLDAVLAYLPAPSERTGFSGRSQDGGAVVLRPADDEPFAGVAFRTVDDPMAGRLTFVRVYSGVVATGSLMLNSVTASPERISRMVRMHANHAEDIIEARAGDIVALAGLEHTTIGDTLCDPAAPVILERIPVAAGLTKH